MKKLCLSVLVLLIAAVVCITPAWSEDGSLASQVNAFYNAVEHMDQEALLELFTPDIAKKITENPASVKPLGEIYASLPDMKEKGGAISFASRSVKVVKEDNDKAVVEFRATVTVTYPSGEKEVSKTLDTLTYHLVEDAWLLEAFKTEDVK